jgi:integrase
MSAGDALAREECSMQKDSGSTRAKGKAKTSKWVKVSKRISGLYRYGPSGVYHAAVRRRGKLYRESLRTTDLAFARRKLKTFKDRLDRTEPRFGKVTFVRWLGDSYWPTLRGSAATLKEKGRIIRRVKDKWVFARTQPMRDITQSQLLTFLNEQFGSWSAEYWNLALSVLRTAFALAVRDHALIESPAAGLTYRKRKKPIRLTPTFEQFRAIIADVRAQRFNADAQDSADFLEACGLLGLGQAELAGMKREHVDLESSRIAVYRQKTSQAFTVPIYPQARVLIERLCQDKKQSEYIFPQVQARKALTGACKRLGFPNLTQRSLRRMFIIRALEKGIDVQTIARWQGHKDGGKLILDTYGHVTTAHTNRMALMLSEETPENVISIEEAGQS